MEVKKLIAELIGTFALALVVLLSSSSMFPIPTPVLAGLTLGLFVYSIGGVSGCHINPAVTIGLLSLKKIKAKEALFYTVAQCVGALLALGLVLALGGHFDGLKNLIDPYVLMAEVLGTAIFTFGIAAVVFGKVAEGATGAVIGGSLLLGISFSALMGGPGFLNPAVALASKSLSLTTLFGPIIGALIGMQVYKFISTKK